MPHTCRVSYTDLAGVRHEVTVTADSLYEAAALALPLLRADALTELVPGHASPLQVEVVPTVVRHQVSVLQVEQWLAREGGSPAERSLRQRLRAVAG